MFLSEALATPGKNIKQPPRGRGPRLKSIALKSEHAHYTLTTRSLQPCAHQQKRKQRTEHNLNLTKSRLYNPKDEQDQLEHNSN